MASVSRKQLCIPGLFLIFLTFLSSGVMSRKLPETVTMADRHEQWMVQYGRVYKDEAEKERRLAIFRNNVEFIESFNAAGEKPYVLGVNAFADLTAEEFRASRNGYRRRVLRSGEGSSTPFKYENVTAVPDSMDWRKKGAVTPVKDQGECGKYITTIRQNK